MPLSCIIVQRPAALLVAVGLIACFAGSSRTVRAQSGLPMPALQPPGVSPHADSVRDMVLRERRGGSRGRQAPALFVAPAAEASPGVPGTSAADQRAGREFRRRGASAPQSEGAGFAGIDLKHQFDELGVGNIPPDVQGVVGPDHVVELLNGSFAVFNRTGTRLSHVSLRTFFTLVDGAVTYPRNGALSPRLVYDRRAGRWFAAALEFGEPAGQANHCLLAVSRTSDPTGVWDKYLLPVGLPASMGLTYMTERVTLGLDSNGVYLGLSYLGSDGFTVFGGILATPLSPLIGGTPALGGVFLTTGVTDMFGCPAPAHNGDAVAADDPAWFVASDPVFRSNIVFRTLTWSGGIPTLGFAGSLTSDAFADPINAPALGSTTAVSVGDHRVQNAVIRSGRLWACRSVGLNSSGTQLGADRTGCEWLELDTSAVPPSLTQTGRIFDPAAADPRFYYIPAISVSGQGHVAVVFSGSKAAEYIGIFTAGRLAGDGAGLTGAPVELTSGEAPYTSLDGLSRNRWGDYASMSVDPRDDMTFWSAHEYATSRPPSDIWGTFISALLAPPPTLANPGASATQGDLGASISLSGTGFFDPGSGFPNRLTVEFIGGAPNGIQNVVAVVSSPTSVLVTFDVAGDASPGTRDIKVTNPDGQSVVVAAGLTVIASTPRFRLSAATYQVAESSGPAEVKVQRLGDTSQPADVRFKVTAGTADSPADFAAQDVVLSFAAAEASRTLDVAIAPDALLEGSETVNIGLSEPSMGNSLASPSSAVLTITDELTLTRPQDLTATPNSVSSILLGWTDHTGNEDGFRIERDSGSGFEVVSTTSPNQTTFSDPGRSPGVAYTYRVRAVRGAVVTDYSNTATATINVVTLSTAVVSLNEGAGFTITADRIGDLSQTSSVTFRTTDGTATAPGDYASRNTVLLFQPGEFQKSVLLTAVGDNLVEGSEQYGYALTSAVNCVLGSPSSGTVTIQDDTATPRPTGLTAAMASESSISLGWTDNCGNEDGVQVERKSGSDPFGLVGTAPAGATSFTDPGRTIGVAYTYRVRAVRGANASDYSNEATATIIVFRLDAATYGPMEGTGPLLTIQRVGGSAGAASVRIRTTDGTATAGTDYTAIDQVLDFSDGQSSRQLMLATAGDQLLEGPEEFTVALSQPVAGVVGTPGSAVVTIQDDPVPPSPTGLTAMATTATRIQVGWTERCQNETAIELERKKPGESFALLVSLAADAIGHLDTTVEPNTAYVYRARAVRSGGLASSYSNEFTVSTPDSQFVLAAAEQSAGESTGSTLVTVLRNGSTAGPASVRFSTQTGTATPGMDYTAVTQTLDFVDGEASRTVTIMIQADRLIEGTETVLLHLDTPVGANLGSPSDGRLDLTDDQAATAPSALRVTKVTDTSIALAWSDNSDNETEFVIECSTGGAPFAEAGRVPTGTTVFTHLCLNAKTLYTYRVRAVQGAASSDPSASVSATTKKGLGKITIKPPALNFGKVIVGQSKTLSIKIKNAGRIQVTGVVGLLNAPFQVTANGGPFCLETSGPGKTRVVSITFTPTVAGAAKATLLITASTKGKGKFKIKLTAKGA